MIDELNRREAEEIELVRQKYKKLKDHLCETCPHDWHKAPIIEGIGQVRGEVCSKCGMWEPFPRRNVSTQST